MKEKNLLVTLVAEPAASEGVRIERGVLLGDGDGLLSLTPEEALALEAWLRAHHEELVTMATGRVQPRPTTLDRLRRSIGRLLQELLDPPSPAEPG